MIEFFKKKKKTNPEKKIKARTINFDVANQRLKARNRQLEAVNQQLVSEREELKKRYADLDTFKDLVQELGSSLKTAKVLQTLIKALEKILPESASFVYAIPSPDPGRPSNLIYIHSRAALGEKYLDCVKDNIASSFDLLPAPVKRKEELAKWIHGKFIFEFIEGTQDNKDAKRPLSSFNVPFVVRDEVLGAINISSSEPNLFTEKDINLVHTMADAAASTISRLRRLLQSEQSRIASLVESLSNGVIMFDLDQRVTLSNTAAQKMTGLPERGFYLSEFTKLFKENFDKKVAGVLRSGELFHIEEAVLSRFAYEIFIVSVMDHEKKIIGGAIILHDITYAKEKTDILKEAKAKDEAVFASIGEGLIITDDQGNIVQVNEAFEKLLGWRAKEVIGKKMLDVAQKVDENGEIIPLVKRSLSRVLSGEISVGKVSSIVKTHSYIRRDKSKFPVMGVVTPIKFNNKILGAVQVFRDITNELEIDKTKTEFVSVASHQLRTPLGSMRWYLEMILNGDMGKINKKTKEALEQVYESNTRIIGLVKDLLDIARIEQGRFKSQPEYVEIIGIIEEAIREIALEAEKKNVVIDFNRGKGAKLNV
ncbi:PAS domain S-box protein [Patescibacteria group bacterium]|nr:PAS domain S-box protein [Patescibacteria group bacterium]MBU4580310.1 PAS domain S-box protein [Patescibacteria group bacterium]